MRSLKLLILSIKEVKTQLYFVVNSVDKCLTFRLESGDRINLILVICINVCCWETLTFSTAQRRWILSIKQFQVCSTELTRDPDPLSSFHC